MKPITHGVYPTMITPFTEKGLIDYPALEALIEWYIEKGVHGLFAVCQSSEMFYLSLEERVELAGFVVEKTAGRIPVIASGHISEELEQQVEELSKIAATGVDAVVMVSNRLATAEESENIWKAKAETLLQRIPEVSFGIYECPYPYKRLLSPELLKWCASTGRFSFLKDTCCDVDVLEKKLDAVKGSSLQVFNANSATLLASMQLGVAGFSGVMANFHPDLYVWLVENWGKQPELAEQLQSFLGMASLIELQQYPLNAKYYLSRSGLPIQVNTRVRSLDKLTENHRMAAKQLNTLEMILRSHWNEKLCFSDSKAL